MKKISIQDQDMEQEIFSAKIQQEIKENIENGKKQEIGVHWKPIMVLDRDLFEIEDIGSPRMTVQDEDDECMSSLIVSAKKIKNKRDTYLPIEDL